MFYYLKQKILQGEYDPFLVHNIIYKSKQFMHMLRMKNWFIKIIWNFGKE